jgi:hypothetical protein
VRRLFVVHALTEICLDKRLLPDFKLIKPLTVRVQHHAGDASLQIRNAAKRRKTPEKNTIETS